MRRWFTFKSSSDTVCSTGNTLEMWVHAKVFIILGKSPLCLVLCCCFSPRGGVGTLTQSEGPCQQQRVFWASGVYALGKKWLLWGKRQEIVWQEWKEAEPSPWLLSSISFPELLLVALSSFCLASAPCTMLCFCPRIPIPSSLPVGLLTS